MNTGLLSLSLLAAAQNLLWYKAHDQERDTKIEECKETSDPRGTEDCRNALDTRFVAALIQESK